MALAVAVAGSAEQRAQLGDGVGRLLDDVPPGVAAEVVAAGTGGAFALMVLLPGVARAVKAV